MLIERVSAPYEDAIKEDIRDQADKSKAGTGRSKNETDKHQDEKKDKERQFACQMAQKLPGKPRVYLSAPPEKSWPWWASYLGINKKELCPETRSAITFLEVKERWFALAFGHAYHWLRQECVVPNFGTRVALNSIDPEKLKSCDVLRIGTPFQIKTQAPASSDVNEFGFDWENESWSALSGVVKKEYADMFRSLSGNRRSVRCCSPVLASDMKKLLGILKDCYDNDAYEGGFPRPGRQPVENPEIRRALYGRLEKSLKAECPDVMLAVPGIIDDGDYTCASLDGDSYISRSDITIDWYYEHARKLGKGGIKELVLWDENHKDSESHPLAECFVFETTWKGKQYCLNEGQWYEIDKELCKQIQEYLKEHCCWENIVDLPEFEGDESDYNLDVGERPDYLCLDKTKIKGQMEPCDLFTTTPASRDDHTPIPTLIHVKKHSSSQQYGHLFNQGLNSAHVILGDSKARSKMNTLIKKTSATKAKGKIKGKKRVAGKKFKKIDPKSKLRVVFAAAIPRHRDKCLDTLPFFSQVSLYRDLKSYDRKYIDVYFQFIYMKEGK